MEGDSDSWYSYYCFMVLKKDIDYWVTLPLRHKIVVKGFIDYRREKEEEEHKEMERKSNKAKSRARR